MMSYVGKNVVKGTRAQDEYMLDWSNVSFEEADATGKQHAGAKYKNQSTKNSKEQRDRTKAMHCTSGCTGKVERNEQGKLVVKTYCPAHFDQHLKMLQVCE
jgi:hypothetical protein